MSYTTKFASSFYVPFREALNSNPCFGDKKTYQMNPANYKEALIELRADKCEGADILLVKPRFPYLNVIGLLRDNSPLPIDAYQIILREAELGAVGLFGGHLSMRVYILYHQTQLEKQLISCINGSRFRFGGLCKFGDDSNEYTVADIKDIQEE